MSANPLVIFGAGPLAEVAHFYFTHDSAWTVAGFTVDREFLPDPPLLAGLPVVPFDRAEHEYPPDRFALFVALSYTRMNRHRADKCGAARAKGYRLASYVSSRATTWPGFATGDNAFILEDNTIQPFVRIGEGVTMWSGNHIGHHAVIGDYVFIASHVVISGGVHVGAMSFLGVNATIRDNVKLGRMSLIGAGSLILADTADEAVYSAQAATASAVPSSRVRSI